MNTIHNSHLKHFQEHCCVLTSLSEQLVAVLETLKMPALRNEASQLKQQCSSIPLKVLVAGEPAHGKSTVINALLREKLLPTHAVQTVPLLYEIKWGRERKAVLHYRLSRDGFQKKPKEVPFAELENYLDIDSDREDLREYEWLELFAPLPICEAGLEITNLAGPYDDDGDLEVTDETQKQVLLADAILFVLGCDSLPSREELLEIDRMKRAGHQAIFFLCNRFDLVEPSIQGMVKQRFVTRLAPLTPYGERNVFFINAKSALASSLSGNREQLRQSNLPQVEEALYIFLAYERGKEKLSRSAARLGSVVQNALHGVSIQERLLPMDQEELQARYTKAHTGLEQLNNTRRHLVTLFTLVRRTLKEKAKVASANFYLDIADIIEGWPQVYRLQQPSSPWDVFAGSTQEREVKELTTFLSEAVQDEFELWKQTTLSSILQERLSRLSQELYEYTRLFASDLKQIEFELTGKEAEGGEEGKSAWEATATKMIQDATTRITSAVAKHIGFVCHSSALVSRLLKQESIQRLIGDGADLERMKIVVGKEYRHELLASYRQCVQAIGDMVDDELRLIQKELDHALGLEIQNIRDTLYTRIAEEQQEQRCGKVAGNPYLLMAQEGKLSSLSSELDSLRTFLKWYRFGLSP